MNSLFLRTIASLYKVIIQNDVIELEIVFLYGFTQHVAVSV